jgi:hypothetical protein
MPNRRKATSSSKAGSSSADSANKSKRIKLDNFGAANDTDDLPPAHVAAQQQQSGPSSAGASVCPTHRTLAAFPTLASLAARVFATHFNTLYILENEYLAPHRTTTRQKLSEKLSELPESLIPKLLALLREHSPAYLNAGVLITVCTSHVAYFLNTNASKLAFSRVVLFERSRDTPPRRASRCQCPSGKRDWNSIRRWNYYDTRLKPPYEGQRPSIGECSVETSGTREIDLKVA